MALPSFAKASRLILVALALFPTVAAAQFSDSYNFLKAVRARDGNEATKILAKPGSTIVDTRDIKTGETALHIVTRGRDLTWLGFLLAKGSKTDLRDSQGNSPLMIAAQIGFLEGAQILLNRRAQVDLANSAGETPLIRAVQNRDAAMVRLLITSGANPLKTDRLAGLSAREYAQRDTRATAIVKILDEAKPAKAVSGPK